MASGCDKLHTGGTQMKQIIKEYIGPVLCGIVLGLILGLGG